MQITDLSNHLPYARYAQLKRELVALVQYAECHPTSAAALKAQFAADVAVVTDALDDVPLPLTALSLTGAATVASGADLTLTIVPVPSTAAYVADDVVALFDPDHFTFKSKTRTQLVLTAKGDAIAATQIEVGAKGVASPAKSVAITAAP